MKKTLAFLVVTLLFLVSVGFTGLPSSVHAYSGNDTVFADRGGIFIQSFSEKIEYDTKNVDDKYLVKLGGTNPTGMPAYLDSYTNATCGIIGGSNIIGGYNKIHTGLIPGFNSVGTVFGSPVWAPTGAPGGAIDTLQGDLYTRMSATPSGVTMVNYNSGMVSYFNSKSYTLTNTSMFSSGTLNLAALKAQIDQDKYATVFMAGFNIVSLLSQTGYDTQCLEEYGGAHIMSVFGYRTVKYYKNGSSSPFRTDNYLEVCTGFSADRALLYLNNYTTINNIYVHTVS